MIKTDAQLLNMPKCFHGFKQYMNRYECAVQVSPLGHWGLIFYKDFKPYVIITEPYREGRICSIYCNRELADLTNDDVELCPENLIKDMHTFIKEIRKCSKG